MRQQQADQAELPQRWADSADFQFYVENNITQHFTFFILIQHKVLFFGQQFVVLHQPPPRAKVAFCKTVQSWNLDVGEVVGPNLQEQAHRNRFEYSFHDKFDMITTQHPDRSFGVR